VEDVEQFPGHIACDGASRSEVVVPIVQAGKVRFGHFLTCCLGVGNGKAGEALTCGVDRSHH
jgi:hypothetical protein